MRTKHLYGLQVAMKFSIKSSALTSVTKFTFFANSFGQSWKRSYTAELGGKNIASSLLINIRKDYILTSSEI